VTGLRAAAGQARRLARQCRYLRVAAAVWRFARDHSPRWLRRVLVVCLIIPGCLDEIVAGAVIALLVLWALRSADSRHELGEAVGIAWRN
jgi:hypothetical protein